MHFSFFAHAMKTQYILRMPQPSTHYFEVEMRLSGLKAKKSILKMASWTPGSYLIREYARNVEQLRVETREGKPVPFRKTAKNSWEIESEGNSNLIVSYRLYANEMAVRNCYLDNEQAYLNPAAVFLYLKGAENKPSTLFIDSPPEFSRIVTALKPAGSSGKEFQIQNLDEFIDSPILCGNPLMVEFSAAGVKHRAAFQGPANVNPERIKADFSKIVEAEKALFNHHPCQDYTFIVHHLPQGGGGLEHSHSTSLLATPGTYDNEATYSGFLGLVAHEYFHLWNAKRLRPHPLGPFDYDNENYTTMLWFVEGLTSYYDDFMLYRAGLTKKERFLDVVGSNLSRTESVPGMYVQSLAEASMDAWIKYYRPNENSSNSQADYYTKGAAIGTLLDLWIIRESKGKYSLDDMMRSMYEEFYLKKDQAYTEEDVRKELSKWLGKKGDVFLEKYIYGLERPDWAAELETFGLKLSDRNVEGKVKTLGLRLAASAGRVSVQGIPSNGPAWNSGLHVGDEIIAVGDRRMETADLTAILSLSQPGDKIPVLYARGGRISVAEIPVQAEPGKSFRLDWQEKASTEQEKLRNAWLRLNQK
jgi:predicted metalloprotease with PDZ domain